VANAVMEQGKGVAALTILWPVMSMAVLMAHLEGWQYVARRHTHSLA
jgi:type II secretory pathway component PulK